MRISTFHNQQGLSLFYRMWLPSKDSKASLVISHGYAEHSGRYKHVAEFLMEQGFAVYVLDHRGHGKSEGARANIKHFNDFATDLCLFLEQVKAASEKKLFLLGHSMGGAIALQTILTSPKLIDGLLLSSPFLQSANPPAPLFLNFLGIISSLLPNFPVQTLDSHLISRDPAIVKAYDNDPLVYIGKVKARLGKGLLDAGSDSLEKASSIKVPTFIIHGSADGIVNPKGSEVFYEHCGAKDKSIKIYDDYYHETLNEFGKEVVLKDIIQWLDSRF